MNSVSGIAKTFPDGIVQVSIGKGISIMKSLCDLNQAELELVLLAETKRRGYHNARLFDPENIRADEGDPAYYAMHIKEKDFAILGKEYGIDKKTFDRLLIAYGFDTSNILSIEYALGAMLKISEQHTKSNFYFDATSGNIGYIPRGQDFVYTIQEDKKHRILTNLDDGYLYFSPHTCVEFDESKKYDGIVVFYQQQSRDIRVSGGDTKKGIEFTSLYKRVLEKSNDGFSRFGEFRNALRLELKDNYSIHILHDESLGKVIFGLGTEIYGFRKVDRSIEAPATQLLLT